MGTRTRTRRGVLAALASIAALAVCAGGAQAAPSQTAVGNFSSGPFTVTFNALRIAGAAQNQANGTFSAHSSLGSLNLFSVSGPVTCLDVVGNTVGLFYPITQASPAALAMLGSGVFLYAQLGPGGKPQSVSFLPVPETSVTSCAPLPGLLPITSGTLALTS